MSEATRTSQFTRSNLIDYAIVVVAMCAPFFFDGLQVFLSGFVPLFKTEIIPKNVIMISVLVFRVAIATGQNPYSDNSVLMIVLACWSCAWFLLWRELDQSITGILLQSYWYQILYWILLAALEFFLLLELTFRKKKIIEKDILKINLEIQKNSEEKKITDQRIHQVKTKVEELLKEIEGLK